MACGRGQTDLPQLRHGSGGNKGAQAAELPLDERRRAFAAAAPEKAPPIDRAGFQDPDKAPPPIGSGTDSGGEEEESGLRDYFLNGEMSLLSTMVIRPAMPPTTVAMPQGVRKYGGTPFLQTR